MCRPQKRKKGRIQDQSTQKQNSAKLISCLNLGHFLDRHFHQHWVEAQSHNVEGVWRLCQRVSGQREKQGDPGPEAEHDQEAEGNAAATVSLAEPEEVEEEKPRDQALEEPSQRETAAEKSERTKPKGSLASTGRRKRPKASRGVQW